MRLTATRELAVACRLRRDPAQVGVAREQTRKAVADWGLGEHSDVAELIVSELATNALRHGDGSIEVLLSYSGGKLRVAVHDDAHGRPVRQRASADDERGRGLVLLDGLAELYGGERGLVNDPAGPGKTVYVAMSLPVCSASGP